jgi:hypothetical protein
MAESTNRVIKYLIHVDGKVYGPLTVMQAKPFKALQHLKGVKFETVWVDAAESRKQKAESRKQKAESRKQKAEPSLLDGLDWLPVSKR